MQVRNYNYKKSLVPCITAMPYSFAPSSTRYGFMNKIMEVHEDGKLIAKMEYHGDGQLAEVRRADCVELFDWDGLALINRSFQPTTESSATAYSNTYINEPAVTGGNPILSNDTVMFNDMLGSTYATSSNGNITSIDRTQFGVTDTKTEEFFTGKPHIKDMGYAFLFRNYRSELSKWQSADPIGYPDGLNNFAYVNNWVIGAIDWLGAATRGVHGRSLAGIAGVLPYQHSWTSLTLTPNEYSGLDNKFKTGEYANAWTSDANGNMTTKISAYEENDKLVKKLNDPRDTNSQGLDFYDDISMNDIKDILDNFDDYNNSADYGSTSQNCNTFTNTVNDNNLPSSMADTNTMQLFIGIGNTLDKKYFE